MKKYIIYILLGVTLLILLFVIITGRDNEKLLFSKYIGWDRNNNKEDIVISSEPRISLSSPSDIKVDFDNNGEVNKDCPITSIIEYTYYEDNADPLWKDNNKFGLYIYAEESNMFEIAQKLVNSNGGKWGYVLIPYNVKDRDREKWDAVFKMLLNKNLIPIIQLWDIDVSEYKKQTEQAAEFLNDFVWPIKYKYISVYNETNDSKFWYGNVNPEEYARILNFTIDIFKNMNEDFFIMNGAFNATAPSDDYHMDEFEYLRRMEKEIPGIFNKIDGWASHPYPQPNFSGDPHTEGRWGIRAYESELDYLKNEIGVNKDFPVFITETGWAHAEGAVYNPSYLPVSKVADNMATAYRDYYLKDDRVRAVTPFTIRYNPPFDHFSWVNSDNVPYYHYEVIKNMKKIEGKPPVLKTEVYEQIDCQ